MTPSTNGASLEQHEARVERAGTASERASLEAFLDYLRAAVLDRAEGVGEDGARRRLVPSATTLGGVLRHLARVERNWFQHHLLGRDRARLDIDFGPSDTSWDLRTQDTVASLAEEYRQACAQSREAAAGLPLDHGFHHPRLGEVSLRWTFLHMIEETARHAGHADILREQVDASADRAH